MAFTTPVNFLSTSCTPFITVAVASEVFSSENVVRFDPLTCSNGTVASEQQLVEQVNAHLLRRREAAHDRSLWFTAGGLAFSLSSLSAIHGWHAWTGGRQKAVLTELPFTFRSVTKLHVYHPFIMITIAFIGVEWTSSASWWCKVVGVNRKFLLHISSKEQ